MEPLDPKKLSDEDVEIILLLGDATGGPTKEANKAIAELLRRGVDIKAGSELANRLIEILDPPKGRPNRQKAKSLYSTRDSPLNKTHARMFSRFEQLYGSPGYKTKTKVYNRLCDEFGYTEEYCKEIITNLTKNIKKRGGKFREEIIRISSPPD